MVPIIDVSIVTSLCETELKKEHFIFVMAPPPANIQLHLLSC